MSTKLSNILDRVFKTFDREKRLPDEWKFSFPYHQQAHLCYGSNELYKKEFVEWCKSNNVTPLIIDAKEISIISFNFFDDNILNFKPYREGKDYNFENIKKCLLNGKETYSPPGYGKNFLFDKNFYQKNKTFVNMDLLPELYFLCQPGSPDPFIISNMLLNKLNNINKPCVIYIENLFTLDNEFIHEICRKFIDVRKTDNSRCGLIAIIANIEKENNKLIDPSDRIIFSTCADE